MIFYDHAIIDTSGKITANNFRKVFSEVLGEDTCSFSDIDVWNNSSSNVYSPYSFFSLEARKYEQQKKSEVIIPALIPRLPVTHVNSKLELVLDLDNTLIHTINQSRIYNLNIEFPSFSSLFKYDEYFKFKIARLPDSLYYIKLRPGVHQFLRVANKYFRLSVSTNATPEYSDIVLSLLDSDRTIFKNR